MSELNPQPLPPRRIRVQIPASVMYDIDKFQEAQRSVLGELGCEGCNSGLPIWWEMYEDFVVNAELQVRPVARQFGMQGR